MNWLKLIELPLQEFALAHYCEALRLKGIRSRSQIANCLRQDFPNGGLSEYLRKLGPHSINEIGLFFFYLGAERVGYKSKAKIHEAYSIRFNDFVTFGKIGTRKRYYYILNTSFLPIIRQMETTKESDEWRNYLDMCVGREQMAA